MANLARSGLAAHRSGNEEIPYRHKRAAGFGCTPDFRLHDVAKMPTQSQHFGQIEAVHAHHPLTPAEGFETVDRKAAVAHEETTGPVGFFPKLPLELAPQVSRASR